MTSNFSIPLIEPWYIAVDIILITACVTAIVLSLLCLIVILLNRQLHTVSNLLVFNSCLCELIFSSVMLAVAGYLCYSDIHQLTVPTPLCAFRGYFGYTTVAAQNWSYLIQAIHRYICVVHHHKRQQTSYHLHICFIVIQWIYCILFPLPLLLIPTQIQYIPANQMCQVPIFHSLQMMYLALCIYLTPVISIIIIYFLLVKYVNKMARQQQQQQHQSTHITLFQARRQLSMLKRIILLIIFLVTCCGPYMSFVLIGFRGTDPYVYHFRIAYIFLDLSVVLVMVAIIYSTNNIRDTLFRSNRILDTSKVPSINTRETLGKH
ncbi:unnamed protein product [Didymodactylos carnosus]|uniref:G-protein coupled receptors family 1 profile domain-containing protein n=1 Tax=Didymodactylos carnosus TaxID=1234261 RepID=A0A814ZBB3_9BILA|nr:unnamed protein product [Didymodactylos carnosus]CAF4003140.1 unnamed protein product [Didymodactylos carnosus]